jgi:hypothetical protein
MMGYGVQFWLLFVLVVGLFSALIVYTIWCIFNAQLVEDCYYRLEANIKKHGLWGLSFQESETLRSAYNAILKVRSCKNGVVVGTAFCAIVNEQRCVLTAMHLFQTAGNKLVSDAQRQEFCRERGDMEDMKFELESSVGGKFCFNVASVRLFPMEDVAVIYIPKNDFIIPPLPTTRGIEGQKCFVFGYSVTECDKGAIIQTVGSIKSSRGGLLRYTADTNKGCSGGAVVVIEKEAVRVVAVHQSYHVLNVGRELGSFLDKHSKGV